MGSRFRQVSSEMCNSMHIMSKLDLLNCGPSCYPPRGCLPLAGLRNRRRDRWRAIRQLLAELLTQHELGDGRQLHVRRAFVDLADLSVAPVFLDGIILGESVAAVNFDGQ